MSPNRQGKQAFWFNNSDKTGTDHNIYWHPSQYSHGLVQRNIWPSRTLKNFSIIKILIQNGWQDITQYFTHWVPVSPYSIVNFKSMLIHGNEMACCPFKAIPLNTPMFTSCQLHFSEQFSMKFKSKEKYFHPGDSILKCHLLKGPHSVPPPTKYADRTNTPSGSTALTRLVRS